MDETDFSYYYDVLLPVPAGGVYTYAAAANLIKGERVVVPFGRREMTGIVLDPCVKPSFACKDVLMRYDETPLFSEKWLEFISRLADYYAVPPGLALRGVLSEKLLNLENAEIEAPAPFPEQKIVLTEVQKKISEAIKPGEFSRHLIMGITGSGKTEVYLDAAKKAIEKGKQALYIVPEISLTPQLLERIAARFGEIPAVFHSKLAVKKRRSSFLAFAKGSARFLVGARSALFVPAKDLGLIIVDEEHEHSFKQEDAPPYHLRDMAVLYASVLNIPVVMGSATPSAESVYNVKTGKYLLHEMRDRPKDAVLPDIEIIDLKSCDMVGGVVAEPMYDQLAETVKRGEQAIIFLNRKGYSTSLYCKKCGEPAMCANCSVGLVYFKSKNANSCRYCGADYKRMTCPSCGGTEFSEWGAGTEKVAEFMETMFPGKVLRIDTENASTIKTLSESLKKFEEKEAQILVGTQLVAKGLHFPSVTFVGVLGIDSLLSMPDFRATERAYQLLVQVSGRAGRENLQGRVYVQTMTPENPIFGFITGEWKDFYDYELSRREAAGFPPYGKLARLLFSYSDGDKCWNAARKVCGVLRKSCPDTKVLGPAEAEISKVKNKYRISVLLKASTHGALTRAIKTALAAFEEVRVGAMMMKTDKDPYFLM